MCVERAEETDSTETSKPGRVKQRGADYTHDFHPVGLAAHAHPEVSRLTAVGASVYTAAVAVVASLLSTPRAAVRRGAEPRRIRSILIAASAVALGAGCAAQNFSRTVGKGNGELHASVGGPFFERLGPPIPVPNANVGGRYGLHEIVDVDANVNLLAAAYGILALDAAAIVQFVRIPRRFAFSGSARLHTFGDLNDAPSFRAYPELGLHAGGQIPGVDWLALYGGVLGLINPQPPIDRPALIWQPFFGTEFLLRPKTAAREGGKDRQQGIALHLAYFNPGPRTDSVVDYTPGAGAIAFYVGWRMRFGGLDR
jgi:hypothetical protein